MRRSVAAVPGIWRASSTDLVLFVQMCDRLGIEPDWLAAVISFESGWNSTAKNPKTGASGLIQFMPKTAAGLGTTTSDLRAMNIAQQLPYVERFLRPYAGRMKSMPSVYAAILGPGKQGANVDAPDSQVIYRSPSDEYNENAPLDKAGKGYITKADLASAAQSKLDAAGGRRIEVDMDAPLAQAQAGQLPVLLLSAAAGWAAANWYTDRYGLRLPVRVRR